MNWSLASAKNHLSELVRRASTQGPQTISVRGHDAAVLISKTDFEVLTDPERSRNFKDWLLSLRGLGELDLERDPRPARDIEL